MILAIGTLVDDAIVVVENVERLMEEEGLSPYKATVKAMDQVTSAVIGTTLVLIAVFIPMAFFPGSTGGIYRQFSVTLAISVAVSTILALSLTPALCAALLRPPVREGERQPLGKRVFAPFNRFIDRTTTRYQGGVSAILVRPLRFLLVFVALVVIAGLLFLRLPGSFIPAEDQGSVITAVQGPPGSTAARTAMSCHRYRTWCLSRASAFLVRARPMRCPSSVCCPGMNALVWKTVHRHWWHGLWGRSVPSRTPTSLS